MRCRHETLTTQAEVYGSAATGRERPAMGFPRPFSQLPCRANVLAKWKADCPPVRWVLAAALNTETL